MNRDQFQDQSFFCENHRYKTDTEKGYSHGESTTRGSVFAKPVFSDAEASLWLEYAIEKKTKKSVLWLMWYGPDGVPIIHESAVFTKQDLSSLMAKLADFIP